MKLYQKIIKGGYYFFFLFIVIGGVCGIILSIVKKKIFLIQLAFLPLSVIAALSWIGTEPRYFAAIYPFGVVFSTYFVLLIYNLFANAKPDSMP